MPYLNAIAPSDSNANRFDYVILSHYHNDHYNGLYALKTGKILTDSIIDPGGYEFQALFKTQKKLFDVTEMPPQKMAIPEQWLDILTSAQPNIGGHSNVFSSFGTTSYSALGKSIVIGNLNGQLVKLQCVAGWGNTLSKNGEIIANPAPNKTNANNYSLAFILSVGEFRYFLGGDLGGRNTSQYIDQETSLSEYFTSKYPLSYSYLKKNSVAGHICGFKANHHGSNHSNNLSFLQNMRPAIGITSAGSNANWHLPSVSYLKDLAKIVPLSVWTANAPDRKSSGYYFTNLYNWGTHNSLTTALQVSNGNHQINVDYGNKTNGKASYMIKVKGAGIAEKSSFEVYRVTPSTSANYLLLASYFCHSN